jgi:type III pantothenate kinase
MLLAVDIGNTQTAIGLFDEADSLVYTGRITTVAEATSDELRVLISSLFSIDDIEESTIDQVIVASVVPALTEHWVMLGNSLGAQQVMVVDAEQCAGLAIRLDEPSEAGADRLANAVGATVRYGAPAIVVDFGTATNIDVIGADGAYRGGVISPGLETSAAALFDHAARLSAVDLEAPDHVVGTSTKSAVQSGLLYGEAAKVDGLVMQIIAEIADAHADRLPVVIATGGLAPRLAPLCTTVQSIDADLTLYGLLSIARSARN